MERKQIKIMIKSTQHDVENTTLESTYQGYYANAHGLHLLSYTESFDGATVKNLYKISDHTLYLSKRGAIDTKMYFKADQNYHDKYKTPLGNFDLLLKTKKIKITITEEKIFVFLNYDLFINHNFVSNCTIELTGIL